MTIFEIQSRPQTCSITYWYPIRVNEHRKACQQSPSWDLSVLQMNWEINQIDVISEQSEGFFREKVTSKTIELFRYCINLVINYTSSDLWYRKRYFKNSSGSGVSIRIYFCQSSWRVWVTTTLHWVCEEWVNRHTRKPPVLDETTG